MAKVFILLCIIGFFAILSSTMSKSPTLPLYADKLGISVTDIGLIAAASTITGIFTNVVAGSLSDIYGRKRLLLASGLFFSTAPFMYFTARNAPLLVAVRAYHGLATAIFTPVAFALIADLHKTDRGEKMGLFSSTTIVSRLIAPALAGYIITFYDFSLVFTICGVSGIVALAMIFRIEDQNVSHIVIEKPSLASGISKILSSSALFIAGIVNATVYFAMQSIETFLPLFLKFLEVDPFITGILFSIEMATIALSKPYFGKLSDKYGRTGFILAGLAFSGSGMVAIAYSRNLILTTTAIVLFSMGVAMVTSSIMPLASELVPKEFHGAAMGALETIKDVGQGLGPIVTSLAIAYMGFREAFLISAFILFIVLILFKYLLK